MSESVLPFFLTQEEVDTLAVAVAKSVDPSSTPADAREAARVVWAHADDAGQPLCSMATMFAEARYT